MVLVVAYDIKNDAQFKTVNKIHYSSIFFFQWHTINEEMSMYTKFNTTEKKTKSAISAHHKYTYTSKLAHAYCDSSLKHADVSKKKTHCSKRRYGQQ